MFATDICVTDHAGGGMADRHTCTVSYMIFVVLFNV